ncbi:MAG: hypothetical protein KJN76_03535, partial [Eudoraea sp.]|nr:hypothetical protein [Eudoraea sp.]
FFSKVYGSPGNISAFNGRLSESHEKFQTRMDAFFNEFSSGLHERHGLEIQEIYLKAIRVDENRNPLAEAIMLGYYDLKTNQYNSVYEAYK